MHYNVGVMLNIVYIITRESETFLGLKNFKNFKRKWIIFSLIPRVPRTFDIKFTYVNNS
jgi:hypothetical protein